MRAHMSVHTPTERDVGLIKGILKRQRQSNLPLLKRKRLFPFVFKQIAERDRVGIRRHGEGANHVRKIQKFRGEFVFAKVAFQQKIIPGGKPERFTPHPREALGIAGSKKALHAESRLIEIKFKSAAAKDHNKV